MYTCLSPEKHYSAVLVQGVSGLLVCSLWLSFYGINVTSTVSEYMLVAFTAEVFLAIVHPVAHKAFVSRRLVAKVVVGVWILILIYYTGFHTGIADLVDNLCYPSYGY